MDLGFYYMANAMGRLVGVLVGGFLYHYTVSLRHCPRVSCWICVASHGGEGLVGPHAIVRLMTRRDLPV